MKTPPESHRRGFSFKRFPPSHSKLAKHPPQNSFPTMDIAVEFRELIAALNKAGVLEKPKGES